MKITEIRTTALLVAYRKAYHWSQGVTEGAAVILVEVHTDEGVVGYGESIGTPSAEAVEALLRKAGETCVGQDPFNNARLMRKAYQTMFQLYGTCSSPRFGAQVLAGLEMALWDVMGKATGRAVHELLGGAVRDHIRYFGFPQGQTPEELAAGAKELADSGCEVIYVKVGRGEAMDMAIVEQVRAAIGDNRRLRLDPNEAWDPLTAARMIGKLSRFDPEFIEQPTRHESIAALAHVKASSPIPIAADQLVFSPEDVYDVCRSNAADIIVLGLHETGGILRFLKAAAIAEAAGLNICLHGLYETGITTCATNQAAAVLANLDDGNQYMNHFLTDDIVASPNLALTDGALPVLAGPGLGFELNMDAVNRAAEAHRQAFGYG